MTLHSAGQHEEPFNFQPVREKYPSNLTGGITLAIYIAPRMLSAKTAVHQDRALSTGLYLAICALLTPLRILALPNNCDANSAQQPNSELQPYDR